MFLCIIAECVQSADYSKCRVAMMKFGHMLYCQIIGVIYAGPCNLTITFRRFLLFALPINRSL